VSEPYYGWAVDAVESLRWLLRVDNWAFHESDCAGLGAQTARIIDVAHVRWATMTAVTAIDLCAAELAVRYYKTPFWSDKMPSFEQVRKKQALLPPKAGAWLDDVANDPAYKLLRRGARDPLTHRFLVRSALIGPGRTPFETDRTASPADRLTAPEVIRFALDFADRHIRTLGETLGGADAPPPPRHA
jgi:hypothetical protein